MDSQPTNGHGPSGWPPWLRFVAALAIMTVLVALFEVVLRQGELDSGRLWRGALIAVAAAAFISFGARRQTPQ